MQSSSGGGTCERAPVRERRSSMQTFSGSAGLVIGGAVPASVARAQAELSDGRRPAVDTVAGERNRGRYAGRLRYFLISTRPADRDDLSGGGLVVVRFLGGDGTLQGPPGSATARARS